MRSVLLTAGAVVGSLCLVVALAGLIAGVKPLVFRSGSMGPEIPAGALGLSRPVDAAELKVGDVVSVVAGDGTRVTHRIVGIAGEGETRTLSLRGDANSAPDAETYPVSGTDRVFVSVPYAGYVVAWVGSPLGLFLLGGFVFTMIVVIFRRPPTGGRRKATGIAAAGAAVAVVVTTTNGTAAAFSDTAAVSSGAVAAYTVPAPELSCSFISVTTGIRFSWPAVSGATSYTFRFGSGASSTRTVAATPGTVETFVTGLTGLTPHTAYVVTHQNFGSVTWTSTESNQVQYRLLATAGVCPVIL